MIVLELIRGNAGSSLELHVQSVEDACAETRKACPGKPADKPGPGARVSSHRNAGYSGYWPYSTRHLPHGEG